MALNFSSIRSLTSLVNMFAGADPTKAQLIPLDNEGREQVQLSRFFQYFPENISDSKGVNYASRNIPGGSHPLYQFINGTDRTISFTAIFTSDEDPAPPDLLASLQGGLEVGNLSNLITSNPLQALNNTGGTKHNSEVESAVIWLRSFLYPRYTKLSGNPHNAPQAPPVCRLYLPNSGVHGTTENGQLVVDSVDCIMTQCDTVYETFYRNGKQRITTVNLTFNETIQTGKANWRFADGSGFDRAWLNGERLKGASIQGYSRVGDSTKEIDTDSIQGGISDAINRVGKGLGNLID